MIKFSVYSVFVSGVSVVPHFKIFPLYFGTVPTVWYFFVFRLISFLNFVLALKPNLSAPFFIEVPVSIGRVFVC